MTAIPYRVLDRDGNTVSAGERIPSGEIVVNRQKGERLFEFVSNHAGLCVYNFVPGDWFEHKDSAAGPVRPSPAATTHLEDGVYRPVVRETATMSLRDTLCGEVLDIGAGNVWACLLGAGHATPHQARDGMSWSDGEEGPLDSPPTGRIIPDGAGGHSMDGRPVELDPDGPYDRTWRYDDSATRIAAMLDGTAETSDAEHLTFDRSDDVPQRGDMDDCIGEEVTPDIRFRRPATYPAPTILQEAQAAVYGDRERSYGHPRDDFARIAALWNGYGQARAPRGAVLLPCGADDVAHMMVLLKMARLMEDPTHRDSWVDIAGYAAAGARAVGVDD